MMHAATEGFSAYSKCPAGVAAPVSQHHFQIQTFQNHSALPNHFEGQTDMNALAKTTASFKRGEHHRNAHLSTTPECSDWLKHQLRRTAAKTIADDCGIGQRAAEGIKAGRNGLTMAHLVTLCRSNPDFRAQFFAFCGGTLEGEPEMVAALSRAINAVMRGK